MTETWQIITTAREEFDRWEALLARLSEEQITAPLLPSHWSIKDIVAHLHAWQLRSIARLEAGRENREPDFPDWPSHFDPEQEDQPHDLNAWLYQQYHEQPWSQVYQQWRDGFLRFLALGEAIPAADLLDPDHYSWMEGHPLSLVITASCEHHHQDHLGPLLIWLWDNGLMQLAP